MPVSGLRAVRAAQAVPPGEAKPEVAVRLKGKHRVVHPVHVRGHQQEPHDPVHAQGDVEVPVIEHGRAVEEDLEQDHRQGRRAQDHDGAGLDPEGDEDLDGVEPDPGGQVKVEIRMMDHVKPPQHRDRVKHHVLQVNDEIQRHHREHDFQPEGPRHDVEDPPSLHLDPHGNPHGTGRREQAQHKAVDEHDAEVSEPSFPLGGGEGPAGCEQLHQGEHPKDPHKKGHANARFVFRHIGGHGRCSGSIIPRFR